MIFYIIAKGNVKQNRQKSKEPNGELKLSTIVIKKNKNVFIQVNKLCLWLITVECRRKIEERIEKLMFQKLKTLTGRKTKVSEEF